MPPSVTSNDANGTLKRAMCGCVRSDYRVGNEESESSTVDGTLLGRQARLNSHRQCHPQSNDPCGQTRGYAHRDKGKPNMRSIHAPNYSRAISSGHFKSRLIPNSQTPAKRLCRFRGIFRTSSGSSSGRCHWDQRELQQLNTAERGFYDLVQALDE